MLRKLIVCVIHENQIKSFESPYTFIESLKYKKNNSMNVALGSFFLNIQARMINKSHAFGTN